MRVAFEDVQRTGLIVANDAGAKQWLFGKGRMGGFGQAITSRSNPSR